MKIIEQAHNQALEVLRACARPEGFFASGLKGGYEAVWARDSMIASLGACLVGDEFKKPFRKSLELLAANQSALGQIPNCVGSYNLDRKSDVTFNSIDSSLWYIIGHYVYAKNYRDKSLLNKYKDSVIRAYLWIRYQDPDEVKIPAQQPTMDWMDAFPHKYGYVLNTQALFYEVLKLTGDNRTAAYVKKVMNGGEKKYISLYNKKLGYYYPWGWKNHAGDREHEEWFDALGNLLAVVTGMASPAIAAGIMSRVKKDKINQPFPCKDIWPPIRKNSKEWKSYFSICDAKTTFKYLNAGVWPFIGGFYAAALVKTKKYAESRAELENLARANLRTRKIRNLKGAYAFNEWLDGRTGRPSGEPFQAWSAGMYIYACECVKRKKILFF